MAGLAATMVLAQRSSATIIDNFQQVLTVMRQPPASGDLLISIKLSAIARRAGLRPGDVITWVQHHRIQSPAELALVIHHLRHTALARVAVTLARRDENIHIHIAVAALHISGLAVVAGVPAPLNPPPTPADQFTLHWHRLPPGALQAHRGGGAEAWYRLFDHHIAVGMVHIRMARSAHTCQMLWSVRAVAGSGIDTRRIRMKLTMGDNRHTPPLLLNSLRIRRFHRQMWLVRRGSVLQTEVHSTKNVGVQIPILFNAIPTPALAVSAIALPHRAGIVLAMPELKVKNIHPRPGCVMQTLGRRAVIFAGEKRRLWGVRVLRLDVPQMTFWIDGYNQILRIDLPHQRALFLAANKTAAQGMLSLPKLRP